MTATTFQLTTLIADLPGVEQMTVEATQHLGLRCVADLLLHLPMRYQHTRPWQAIGPIIDATTEQATAEDQVEVRGEVVSVKRGFGRTPKVEVVIDDPTGDITLVFFNQPWIQRRLHPGQKLAAIGTPRTYRSSVQMANPTWRALDDDAVLIPPNDASDEVQIQPVYPASEAITSSRLAALIQSCLDQSTL